MKTCVSAEVIDNDGMSFSTPPLMDRTSEGRIFVSKCFPEDEFEAVVVTTPRDIHQYRVPLCPDVEAVSERLASFWWSWIRVHGNPPVFGCGSSVPEAVLHCN